MRRRHFLQAAAAGTVSALTSLRSASAQMRRRTASSERNVWAFADQPGITSRQAASSGWRKRSRARVRDGYIQPPGSRTRAVGVPCPRAAGKRDRPTIAQDGRAVWMPGSRLAPSDLRSPHGHAAVVVSNGDGRRRLRAPERRHQGEHEGEREDVSDGQQDLPERDCGYAFARRFFSSARSDCRRSSSTVE